LRLPAADAETTNRLEAGEDDEGKGGSSLEVVVVAPVKSEQHSVQEDAKEKGKPGLGFSFF
jgi:hypothetical protein